MTENFENICILISDDDKSMRDIIKFLYAAYDFKLIEAVNGQEAVEMARTYKPHLILLDLEMPVLNGFEAAAILKNDEAVKDIPIIIITGQNHAVVSKRINGLYAEFLSKPINKADLIRATIQCLPTAINKNGNMQKGICSKMFVTKQSDCVL